MVNNLDSKLLSDSLSDIISRYSESKVLHLHLDANNIYDLIVVHYKNNNSETEKIYPILEKESNKHLDSRVLVIGCGFSGASYPIRVHFDPDISKMSSEILSLIPHNFPSDLKSHVGYINPINPMLLLISPLRFDLSELTSPVESTEYTSPNFNNKSWKLKLTYHKNIVKTIEHYRKKYFNSYSFNLKYKNNYLPRSNL